VEEALVFASDIKDMVQRCTPGIEACLTSFEDFYREHGNPEEILEVQQRCAFMRNTLANCKREAERYEKAVKLSAPWAGYPYLLNEKEA
jgi:hypothetical protein